MPLLFYFPLIVWMGMFDFMREEMREPVKVKASVATRR
jgi:hypothetical protein